MWRATPPEHSSVKSFAWSGIGDRIRQNAEPFLAEVDASLTLVGKWRDDRVLRSRPPCLFKSSNAWNGTPIEMGLFFKELSRQATQTAFEL